ncbi:MAG: lipopolysaccharide kinase InaA family protein [Rariglobus sp.]
MSSEGEPMVLKYYYPKTPLKHLTYGLLGSRARRSWETGCAWVRLGIPTAEPLALFEWKTVGGLWLSRSFLAARHVSGVSLATFVLTADANQLAAVAGALRTAFTRMEQHRAAHGDLKATNIIVGENHGVTFIDLDAAEARVTAARWVTLRKRDEHVFFQNWKLGSAAHTAFQSVFAK